MIRLLTLAAPLILSGCGQVGMQLAIAGVSYVSSANNLGAETLRFIDNKKAGSCVGAPSISSSISTAAAPPIWKPDLAAAMAKH